MRYWFVLSALVCALVIAPAFNAFADTTADQRAALQAQLDQIEKDIANNQGVLSDLKSQHATLETEIAKLDNEIKTAQLHIKQTTLTITKIQGDITDKQQSINQTNSKVDLEKQSLAQLIRNTNEIDTTSFATFVLSSDSLTDAFQQIDSYQTIQASLGDSFTQLAKLKTQLGDAKASLEDKQQEQQQVLNEQVVAKQTVQQTAAQKQNILTQTKGQEKTYQQIIADKQKQADAIRQALFGLRDTGAIQFGTAYQYAKEAEAQTNVPAALTLAILTQETDLGANLGSCFVTDLATGNGINKKSGKSVSKVMAAPRDTVPFQTITDALGLDWSNQQVSCPQSIGYGGAMGAAQFIPSTWMLYKDRLAQITGASFPNPWNARTAVFAVALYMEDLGAGGGTTSAIRNAACKYFSGRSCSGTSSVYGDSVVNHMGDIQAQIDIIASAQ